MTSSKRTISCCSLFVPLLLTAAFAGGCDSGDSGEAACFAAGGECVVGSCPSGVPLATSCTGGSVGPGAPVCCVPCPIGTMPDESQVTCVANDAGAADGGAVDGDAGRSDVTTD